MADIEMRFHKDMLVCTDSVCPTLRRQGADVDADFEMMLLIEQDSIQDVYRVEKSTNAQCMVTESRNLLPAKLAHRNLANRLPELAQSALSIVTECKPQHALVELGTTGLPLDSSSKTSLKENRDQYCRAARAFEAAGEFDGYLLSGFDTVSILKCALMGLRMVSDKPILATVKVDKDGALVKSGEPLEDAIAVMAEYGASVAGFETAAAPKEAVALAKRAVAACRLPIMVTLEVVKRDNRQSFPTPENPYFNPNQVFDVALALRAAGVQFLRASGDTSPAYTGGLAACLMGLYVHDVRGILDED